MEFASLPCPHCREFNEAAADVLKSKYVAAGKVSLEFRSFILNGIDVPISLLAYCQPPAAFFATQKALFDTQEEWLGHIQRGGAELERLQRSEEHTSELQSLMRT